MLCGDGATQRTEGWHRHHRDGRHGCDGRWVSQTVLGRRAMMCGDGATHRAEGWHRQHRDGRHGRDGR